MDRLPSRRILLVLAALGLLILSQALHMDFDAMLQALESGVERLSEVLSALDGLLEEGGE